ncbi:hypothetical protein O0L34_g18595 [Tuta absoluta]|nr:hypothetical protein O0L34_g18595 [Tuta absoluta]
MLFIISAFLYSAKFWPDVYTYISANVTIKHIPTVSELNITIFEPAEFTTEGYFATDVTDSTDIDDFTGTFEEFFNNRKRRDVLIEDIGKDYIEMPKTVVVHYVFDVDDNETNFMTALKDAVDETKLTKTESEDVEMLDKEAGDAFQRLTNDTSNPASVFPWLAAIFLKNGTNNQFDYYCDGTIISDRAVLTAARCLQRGNETVNADDVIVFLGKRSLQKTAEGEVILRVNQITLHPNFSLQNTQNDLAVVQLEETAVLSELIQPACLVEDEDSDDAVATAWGESLSLIKLTEKNDTCVEEPVENTFCATYGASVALCPSYGGIYAALQSGRWCAAGLRTGDVTKRGLCFDKTVAFTDLRAYTQWLKEFV